MTAFLSTQAQHSTVCVEVGARLGKVIESAFRRLYDVTSNERRALFCTLLAIFQAVLPFQDGPSFEVVLRELGKDSGEINLAIAKGPEPPCTRNPRLIPAINALAPVRTELSVLYMEH